MALEIRWTTMADITLDQLIVYLEHEWGERVVKAFMKKLYDFLDIVAEFPEIGAIKDLKSMIQLITKGYLHSFKVDLEVDLE